MNALRQAQSDKTMWSVILSLSKECTELHYYYDAFVASHTCTEGISIRRYSVVIMNVRLCIKFGAKEHLEQMQREGIFYCNTITFFSTVEDEIRGDAFESVSNLEYLEKPLLQIKPANDATAEWKKVNALHLQLKESYSEPLGNLFCMSAFKLQPRKLKSVFAFDTRFKQFEYGLLILRQDLFMTRLRKVLKELKIKSCLKFVDYLDLHKYSGQKNLFQKDLLFSWQEELRLLLYTDKFKMNDPFLFSIGSIKDISEIIKLSKTPAVYYKLG